MRVLARVLVSLPLLAAGCLDPLLGHCGPTIVEATWTEAGLYEALGAGGGARAASAASTPAGLPFDSDAQAAAWPGRVLVEVLAFDQVRLGGEDASLPSQHAHLGLRPVAGRPGVANLTLHGPASLERGAIESWLSWFANGTHGTAEGSRWAAWVLTNESAGARASVGVPDGQGGFREVPLRDHHAHVPAPTRLGALHAERHAAAAADPFRPGEGRAEAGNVSFAFALPVRTTGDARGTLSVDTRDFALFGFEGNLAEEEGEEVARRHVEDAFAAWSLPAPTLEAFQTVAIVC